MCFGYETVTVSPDPESHLADRTGTGDGLLQAVLGIQLPAGTGLAFMAEHGHWFVLQNDPGDSYRFVPTNVFGVAMRFGRSSR